MKKNWIRDASMKRLTMLVRNETNYAIDGFIGNKLPIGTFMLHILYINLSACSLN